MSDDSTPPEVELNVAPPPAGEGRARLAEIMHGLARVYLVATSAGYALFALLLAVMPSVLAGAPQGALSGVLASIALATAGLGWLSARRLRASVGAGALLGTIGVGAAAAMLGWGASAPALGFAALHVAVAIALAGRGAGVLVGAVAVLQLGVLALAQQRGWLPVGSAGAALPLMLLVQLMLLLLSGLAGWMVGRTVRRFVAASDDRERRFRGLLRIAADAYWEIDAHARITQVTLERNGGLPVADPAVIGAVPWELPAFGCDPEVLDRLQAEIDARNPFRDVPMMWRLPSGVRHVLVSGEPRIDARGVFQGYWGVASDISDDLQARQALVRTESMYQDLFTSLPTPLVLHRNGRVVDANPAAVAMFGFGDRAAMLGGELFAHYADGDSRERARRRAEQLQTLPPGEALPVAEFELTARHGRQLVVRATGVAVETERGPGVLSIYVDDTDRQAAEQAVRRSEALLSHLVASSPDVITLTDLETGRYAMVNETFEAVTGWAADEVIGRTSAEIGAWENAEDREAFAQQVRAHGRVQDWPVQFVRRDGRELQMLVSGARFVMDRRDYLVINARDMTEVERGRLVREAILENASIGIALTRDRRFQMVNPAFESMLGWPDGSIIGQPGGVVWPTPQDYEALGARIGPALARGEQVEVECEVRRRDGSRFLCRMLARAVDPTHPSRGGTIWIVEDITERKRVDAALARARDDAEAASRAKSAFLANTSHELRTPLNGLLGLAQLARHPGTDVARRTQYLDQIVDSAQALALIVSDILDLSKIEAGELALESEPFDLPAMLRAAHRSCQTLAAPRGLGVALELDPALGAVRGDALRVRQILTNFVSNAAKFTFEGGIRIVALAQGGDRVRFEVHDTGVGIDAATRERLFKPFSQADESTTRRFGGTGLGLSICRELAGRMGGAVGVDSEPGRGSCFWAELPLPAAPPIAPEALSADPAAASIQGTHVLVVDDNEVNMLVAVAQLEQYGARVGQAGDGDAALQAVAAAEAAGDSFDLVMMDLQMPGLSGFEVTRRLRQRPGSAALPIVAHTAAALVSERDEALAAGMNDFLPKPTEPERLRLTVARWARRPGA